MTLQSILSKAKNKVSQQTEARLIRLEALGCTVLGQGFLVLSTVSGFGCGDSVGSGWFAMACLLLSVSLDGLLVCRAFRLYTRCL